MCCAGYCESGSGPPSGCSGGPQAEGSLGYYTHTTYTHTTYTHTHIYIYTCICIHTSICIHTRMYIHSHTLTNTHTYTYTHIHTCTHKHVYMCVNTCVSYHSRIDMYIMHGQACTSAHYCFYSFTHLCALSNTSCYRSLCVCSMYPYVLYVYVTTFIVVPAPSTIITSLYLLYYVSLLFISPHFV